MREGGTAEKVRGLGVSWSQLGGNEVCDAFLWKTVGCKEFWFGWPPKCSNFVFRMV